MHAVPTRDRVRGGNTHFDSAGGRPALRSAGGPRPAPTTKLAAPPAMHNSARIFIALIAQSS
jgi:hypothetical protein